MYNKILIKILYKKELAGRGHRQLPRELLHLLLRGSLGKFLASTFGRHHTASCQHRSAQQGLINPSPQTYRLVSRRVKIELIIKKSVRPKPVNSCPPELGLQACATRPGQKRVTRPFLCQFTVAKYFFRYNLFFLYLCDLWKFLSCERVFLTGLICCMDQNRPQMGYKWIDGLHRRTGYRTCHVMLHVP